MLIVDFQFTIYSSFMDLDGGISSGNSQVDTHLFVFRLNIENNITVPNL